MTQKEFLESMKELIPESDQSVYHHLDKDGNIELCRLTKTHHVIYNDHIGVFLHIDEYKKVISLDTPLEELPEAVQRLVNDGEKAGYKITQR